MLFLHFTFAALLYFAVVIASCPEGSFEWQNYCYIFNATETGFAKAETICVKNGGHLVSIHDAFLNAVIGQYASDYFNQSSNAHFWIGLNSLNSNNVWNWTDGSSLDYNDWSNSKPQNSSSNSMCASVSMLNGYWRNESCFSQKPFVCGFSNESFATTPTKTTLNSTTFLTSTPSSAMTNTSQVISTTTVASSQNSMITNCSLGWTYFNYTKSLYCAHFYEYSWQDGENYCKNLGGHLTSIHSDEENRFVFAVTSLTCYGPMIGLYTANNGTIWQWSDNSKYDYFEWRSDCPNVNMGSCALLGGTCGYNLGEFVNAPCTTPYPNIVVCKKNY